MARIGARALASFVVTFDRRRNVVRFVRAVTEEENERVLLLRKVGSSQLLEVRVPVVDLVP